MELCALCGGGQAPRFAGVQGVKPESGMGKLRTMYQDNMLPIGSLVRIPEEQDAQLPVNRPVT